MVGEALNNTGEQGNRAQLEQKLGSAALAELEKIQEIAQNMHQFNIVVALTPYFNEHNVTMGTERMGAALRIKHGGGTAEELQALAQAVESGVAQAETPTEEAAPENQNRAEVMARLAAKKDRNGNPLYSQDTLERLAKIESDTEFEEHVQALANEGNQAEEKPPVSDEAQRLLGEESPEEFLEAYYEDIIKLADEAPREKAGVRFASPEAREYVERHYNDAIATLNEMKRKYNVVLQAYPNAGKELPPEIEGEAKPEGEQAEGEPGAAELEMNEVGNKLSVDDAITVLVAAGLTKAEAEALKAKLAKKPEAESGDDFAEAGSGAPTPEEVAAAAAAAGQPYRTAIVRKAKGTQYPQNDRQRREAWEQLVRESVPGRFDKYDEELQRMRREQAFAEQKGSKRQKVERPAVAETADIEDNTGRFDQYDEELQRMERERLAKEVRRKVNGRKPFRRWAGQNLRRAATMILMLSVTAGITIGAARTGDLRTVNATTAQPEVVASGVTTGEYVAPEAEATAPAAEVETLSPDLGITAEDLNSIYEGELDFTDTEAWNRGAELYDGLMEREGSQEMENGLRSNYNKFHDENKERKNSWSAGYVDKLFDAEGNLLPDANKIAARETIDLLRDEPQALASFVAVYPGILERCGVDASIVSEQNVETRAKMLMDLMLADGGGDLQKKLLGGLDLALNNENTEYTFYRNYDAARSFYFKQAADTDGTADGVSHNPLDYAIGTDLIQRNGDWYFRLRISYAGGGSDGGNHHPGCGGQTDLDVETYEVVQPVLETTTTYTVTVPFEDGDETFIVATSSTEQEEVVAGEPEREPDDDSDEDPQGEPEKEPEEGEPEEEIIKPKDEVNLVNVVENGKETQQVDTQSDKGVLTSYDSTILSNDRVGSTLTGQEASLGQSAEGVAAAQADQAAAETNTNVMEDAAANMSDEQMAAFLDSLANAANNTYTYDADAGAGEGGAGEGGAGEGGAGEGGAGEGGAGEGGAGEGADAVTGTEVTPAA